MNLAIWGDFNENLKKRKDKFLKIYLGAMKWKLGFAKYIGTKKWRSQQIECCTRCVNFNIKPNFHKWL